MRRFRLLTALPGLPALLLLLAGCGGYVTPGLPVSGTELSYDVVPVTPRTAPRWQAKDAPPPIPDDDDAAPPIPYDYVLGPGDRLSLIIYTFDATGEDDEARIFPDGLPVPGENEFLVAADGSVNLPYIGRLHVAGRRFAEVRRAIASGLKRYFVQPHFEARIVHFGHGRINVTGEVASPGEYPLSHDPLSVTAALQRAGGALESADLAQAELLRGNGRSERLDLVALLHRGDMTQNRILLPGDRLNIPRHHGNRIFLTGEVIDPQALAMHPLGFTLTEALQEAGGIHPVFGDPSHVYVLRSTPRKAEAGRAHVTVFHLNAADLSALALADRFVMQPRDIVYVGIQPITQWNRFLSQFLPSGLSTIIGPQV